MCLLPFRRFVCSSLLHFHNFLVMALLQLRAMGVGSSVLQCVVGS